jgi:FkbM family methyltransferase
VNSAYLFAYRSYVALKKSVIGRSVLRWPAVQRGLDAAKGFLQRRFLPDRQLWLQVQSGFAQGMWMRLRMPEEAGFWRGEHEPEVQATLTAFVRPGDVVYDVGAHLGSIALGAARLVGPTGKVVAFDGDPVNIDRLQENCARNHLESSFRVVHAAVWSHSAAEPGISFRRARAGTSQGGVEAGGQRPVLADGEMIHVSAVTLDDFVGAGAPPPNLIKIDVEGGECEVLAGAANLFRTQRPLLIVEVHHRQADGHIRAWLEEFRYAAEWKIPKQDFPRCLIAWPAERDPRPQQAPQAAR